jgi:hypothetical protein
MTSLTLSGRTKSDMVQCSFPMVLMPSLSSYGGDGGLLRSSGIGSARAGGLSFQHIFTLFRQPV